MATGGGTIGERKEAGGKVSEACGRVWSSSCSCLSIDLPRRGIDDEAGQRISVCSVSSGNPEHLLRPLRQLHSALSSQQVGFTACFSASHESQVWNESRLASWKPAQPTAPQWPQAAKSCRGWRCRSRRPRSSESKSEPLVDSFRRSVKMCRRQAEARHAWAEASAAAAWFHCLAVLS